MNTGRGPFRYKLPVYAYDYAKQIIDNWFADDTNRFKKEPVEILLARVVLAKKDKKEDKDNGR